MAKEFSQKFYHSKAWKQCRKSFITKRMGIDGGMCQCGCGELGYIVDHIEELTPENINNPDVTLNHDNLQYLSLKCHNTKTFGRGEGATRPGTYFNEYGELVEAIPTPPIENS